MEKENKQSAGNRFDARILSLGSRNIGSGISTDYQSGGNAFYSFCYYDTIRVEPTDLQNCSNLRNAYSKACDTRKKYSLQEIPQSIVLVTDISSQSDLPGYTKEQIHQFWDDQDAPILFVSMLNLSHTADLEEVLRLIKEKFPSQSHLAYLTFDHCDIVILGRGDNFSEYTSCIFDLCYAVPCMPEDIITIYGFAPGEKHYTQPDPETFQASIHLGIRDYTELEKFVPHENGNSGTRLCQGKSVYVSWLLGRNDVNLTCLDASLPWLRQVRDALTGSYVKSPWYTTYTLTIFVRERNFDWTKSKFVSFGTASLEQKMKDLYQAFEDAYRSQYRRLTADGSVYYPDLVWLRWLKESSNLAISLLKNPLSSNFGTCLVPQFLDLLEYGRRLFEVPERCLSQRETEKIQHLFSVFFSNAAVLVDSLNQTNRQFVQVPAFHLPSFEVPPQIMAYYTAMAHRILDVLRDKDYFYGLMISPKLVNTLSVDSLALPEILKNDEWLDINMDEESFYTLKLTTETLSHEIAHFVGEDNRNREKRKRYLLHWTFQELMGMWYMELRDRIPLLFCLPDSQPNEPGSYPSWDAFCNAARELRNQAEETEKKYQQTKDNQRKDVQKLILQAARDACYLPQLREAAFEQIWKLLSETPEGRTLIEQVQAYVCWELNLNVADGTAPTTPAAGWIVNVQVRDRVKRLLHTVLEDVSDWFNPENSGPANPILQKRMGLFRNKVCYMFGETFADLQAIMLLDMKWDDYCILLKRSEDRELIPDCPPRMLAVMRALLDCGIWDADDPVFAIEDDVFDSVRKFAFVSSEEFIMSLFESEFDALLLYCLVGYLKECVKSIKNFLADDCRKSAIKEIRDTYKVLSDSPSMFILQQTLMASIQNYQMDCLGVHPMIPTVFPEKEN